MERLRFLNPSAYHSDSRIALAAICSLFTGIVNRTSLRSRFRRSDQLFFSILTDYAKYDRKSN